jgi:hypothetical protein
VVLGDRFRRLWSPGELPVNASKGGASRDLAPSEFDPVLYRTEPDPYRYESDPVRTQPNPCERCAVIAAYADIEPEQLEPIDHARMVIEWYQSRGLFGFRLASSIKKLYPTICEEKNIVPIGVNRVLAHLRDAGARKERQRREAPESTGTVQNRRGYWIPKPKSAKVVAIDRRTRSRAGCVSSD